MKILSTTAPVSAGPTPLPVAPVLPSVSPSDMRTLEDQIRKLQDEQKNWEKQTEARLATLREELKQAVEKSAPVSPVPAIPESVSRDLLSLAQKIQALEKQPIPAPAAPAAAAVPDSVSRDLLSMAQKIQALENQPMVSMEKITAELQALCRKEIQILQDKVQALSVPVRTPEPMEEKAPPPEPEPAWPTQEAKKSMFARFWGWMNAPAFSKSDQDSNG